MIFGQHTSKVGAKKRVAFPKKFRIDLGDELIITYGFEKSLIFLSKNDWEEFIKTLGQKSFLLPEVRDVERYIIGGAVEVKLDEQGRFVLPDYLKDFSKIKKEVVFIGMRTYGEIWDNVIWNEYRNLMHIQMRQTAQRLVERIGNK